MQDQIKKRLEELRKEYEAGETEFKQLQEREVYLREALVRIGGAIQVLEEFLDERRKPE